MDRPLADYSRGEVLTLIEVAVTAYQEQMVEAHERQTERDRAYFDEQLRRPAKPAGSEVPFWVLEVGHGLEELAIGWLRLAGSDLDSRKSDGGQFGCSVAGGRIQGHVDEVSPSSSNRPSRR